LLAKEKSQQIGIRWARLEFSALRKPLRKRAQAGRKILGIIDQSINVIVETRIKLIVIGSFSFFF
jgi:hypothetical protein